MAKTHWREGREVGLEWEGEGWIPLKEVKGADSLGEDLVLVGAVEQNI